MSRIRRAVLLASAAVTAGACANVIGVADHRNAVAELCGPCTQTMPDCAAELETSLTGASEAEVIAWLEEYGRLGCEGADCSLELARCFYAAPGLCAPIGSACDASETCCGFDFDDTGKGAGCCDGGGSPTCCDDCKTCAERVEAYANQDAFDDATLCRSHAKSWKDLLTCATDDSGMMTGCLAACTGAVEMPDLCKGCLAERCAVQFKACGENEGF